MREVTARPRISEQNWTSIQQQIRCAITIELNHIGEQEFKDCAGAFSQGQNFPA